MYKLISIVITVLLLPITIPVSIYAGLKYRWQDTVPDGTVSDAVDDLDDETTVEWLMAEGYTEQEAHAYVNQQKDK